MCHFQRKMLLNKTRRLLDKTSQNVLKLFFRTKSFNNTKVKIWIEKSVINQVQKLTKKLLFSVWKENEMYFYCLQRFLKPPIVLSTTDEEKKCFFIVPSFAQSCFTSYFLCSVFVVAFQTSLCNKL